MVVTSGDDADRGWCREVIMMWCKGRMVVEMVMG